MSTFTPLKTDTAWFRLDVDDGDWRNEDPILLARLLEQYGTALRGPTFPLAASVAVTSLEKLVTDPNGLLVSDVRDLVALRLDEMMASLFGLNNLPAALGDDKTKYQGERYLLRYLRAFSYFRRLDLLEDRGRRPAVHQDDASPRGMDR